MAGEDKTEKATPRKRKKAREEGDVLQSKEIISAFTLLAIFIALRQLAPFMLQNLMRTVENGISSIGTHGAMDSAEILKLGRDSMGRYAVIVLPVMVIAGLVSVLFTAIQTRFVFSGKSLKPKFSHINPMSGIKRMISIRAIVEVIKGLLKISIIGYVMYSELVSIIKDLPNMLDVSITTGILYLAEKVYDIAIAIGILYIFLAVLDYMYQRFEHEKKLRMSKQEVKEEYKNIEGDPQVKGRIKQKQQEIAQQRMMAEVPEADVVIRNPTHYAVAIKYDHQKDIAPRVVAKGAGYVALRIIDIATEHKVELVENRPLARALYEQVELDRQVPVEFYHAVAEVLAAIYELKNTKL